MWVVYKIMKTWLQFKRGACTLLHALLFSCWNSCSLTTAECMSKKNKTNKGLAEHTLDFTIKSAAVLRLTVGCVMDFRLSSQCLSSLLWCQVSLWQSQHLIANHELLHGGRTKQWGQVGGMQLPVWHILIQALSSRCTMPAHGIWKWCVEQVVILR